MYARAMLFVMISVLGFACTGNLDSPVSESPDLTPQQEPGEQTPAVPTMGPAATPDDALPPLPVISLEQRGQSHPGAQGSYCWPMDREGQTIREVCAETAAWSGVESTVPIARGNPVSVNVEAQDPPTRLVAHIFATPEGPGVPMLELEPARRTQLPLDLGPGSYLLRISGTWPEGQVDYEFQFMLVPGGDGLVAECFHTEAEPLPLTFDVLHDATPTGFDGRNSTLCRFSKPVYRVSVLLENEDGSRHGETFFLQPPLYEVSFPLPDGLMSEETLALLRPGDYQRTMQVIAEDGEILDITANFKAALRTVTVIPARPPTPTATPSPAATPTATPTRRPTATPSPAATPTATPTPVGGLPPLTLSGTACQAYLRLLVSSDSGDTNAVVTSYQCGTMHVDSTARYPAKTPSLVVKQGAALHLRLEVPQVPTTEDVRLYSGAGISGSFFKWPEQLPGGKEPVESLQPTPSLVFSFVPEAAQGDYSLVVRVIWDGQVDVFYATSLGID